MDEIDLKILKKLSENCRLTYRELASINNMSEYGFTEMNLHKIYSGVFDPNSRSLRAAEKLGFVEEGVLKEEMYVDGKYVDVHKFGLFKRDWLSKREKNDSS